MLLLIKYFFLSLLCFVTLSCGKKSGTFFAGALGLGADRVIITSQLATVLTVSMYDMEGNFLATLADYQTENNGPRGLAVYDATNVLVSLDGDDRVDKVSLGGGYSAFIQSSLLTGTIGKIIKNPNTGDYFLIESNTMIERFSGDGQRLPAAGLSFVSGAFAPCAAPGSLRALVVNNSGDLIATQLSSAVSFRYTIGLARASACTAIAVLPTTTSDIINHSDGNLYWIGNNNQVYRATQDLTGSTSISNNVSIIAAPTAMAELPNGDLLIASNTTDSLEVIGTDGTYRGSFHKGVHTQQVHSIVVVRGQ